MDTRKSPKRLTGGILALALVTATFGVSVPASAAPTGCTTWSGGVYTDNGTTAHSTGYISCSGNTAAMVAQRIYNNVSGLVADWSYNWNGPDDFLSKERYANCNGTGNISWRGKTKGRNTNDQVTEVYGSWYQFTC